jgi:hypothetical protein
MIDECDPIAWLLARGKALERSCDFVTAIKYYFAGRMFFARLHESPALYQFYTKESEPTACSMLRKRKKLEEEFKKRYVDLLPMTNAEVLHFFALSSQIMRCLFYPQTFTAATQAYASARESVHFQNVVLKRGTMQK